MLFNAPFLLFRVRKSIIRNRPFYGLKPAFGNVLKTVRIMVHDDVTVKNGRKFECIKEEFCLLVCAYFSPTRFSPSISVDIEQIDQSISDKIRNANNALLPDDGDGGF